MCLPTVSESAGRASAKRTGNPRLGEKRHELVTRGGCMNEAREIVAQLECALDALIHHLERIDPQNHSLGNAKRQRAAAQAWLAEHPP